MDNAAQGPSSAAVPESAPAKKPPRTFKQFLETAPPDTAEEVSERSTVHPSSGSRILHRPNLQLHCESGDCGGTRTYYCSDENNVWLNEDLVYTYLTYVCRNCRKSVKKFSIVVVGSKSTGVVQKLGEHPPFGPPTPSRLFKLIGEEYRQLFLQGRRAENRGLGIGAYAYYRRIVEHQKGMIIEEIGKVAKKLGATPDTMKAFSEAKSEKQFKKAIEMVRAGIPPSLLIDSHNPLALLHDALSDGIHEFTDEECLELATTIRLLLTELSERIATALKEEAELKSAVGRLLNRKST